MACSLQKPDYPSGATQQQETCGDAAYAQYNLECYQCNGDFACEQQAATNFWAAWNACFGIED